MRILYVTADGLLEPLGFSQVVRVVEGLVRRGLRYDILSLFWNGRRFVVTHFPDAFRPVSDPVRPWKWRV